jgi:lipid-binding SYLF domain-containing protein
MQRFVIFLVAMMTLALGISPASADTKTDLRTDEARKVLEAFTDLNEQQIPSWLLARAYGIVIVPDVVKGALIVGGRGGRGVMAVRHPDGSWSNPVFVTLAGVNFGFQWGVQSTDLILVLMSRQSVEGISGGTVTLGADASVAAGPVGRAAAATTDATFKAQVLSYSRAEGMFVGVSLDGTMIRVDDGSNQSAYGVSAILPSQILEGRVASPPQSALDFTAALDRATRSDPDPGAAAEPAEAAPTAPPIQTTAPQPPAGTDGGVTTYPMEDPNPGAPAPE